MQVFVAIAVTLVFWGTSSAEEFERAEIYSFFKCLACENDPTGRDEYMDICAELKPEIANNLANDCKAKHMPTLTTREERWGAFCKNEDNIGEHMFNCIYSAESMKDFNNEEKNQFGEFLQCYKNMNRKYCNAH